MALCCFIFFFCLKVAACLSFAVRLLCLLNVVMVRCSVVVCLLIVLFSFHLFYSIWFGAIIVFVLMLWFAAGVACLLDLLVLFCWFDWFGALL